MPTIERRHTAQGPRYRVKVRLTGTRALSRTFPALQQARQWGVTTESAVLAARHVPMVEASRHTLAALIDRYRREVLPRKSSGTQRNHALQLTWWQTHLGYLRLVELSPARLVECRESLAQTRSPGTVNQYLSTLGHALAVAVTEWQWLEVSPMRRVQKLRLPPPRARYLSDEERARLLAACQASQNRLLYPVVMLALATGGRKQELLRLTWADIDLRRRELRFRHTKNRTPRVLPLAGPALPLLQAHARVRRLDTPLVFPRPDGQRPVDLRYAWHRALQVAQIPDFRWHDLRHSAASYLGMSGATLVEIAEVLGHKTLQMVRRYTHISESHTRNVVERMTTAIFG